MSSNEVPSMIDEDPEDLRVEPSTNLRRPIIGHASTYRESEETITLEVSCSTTIQQEDGKRSRFNMHPLSRIYSKSHDWMKTSKYACWHCCHNFEGNVVYVPHSCTSSGVYSVYGNFCSFPCAKSYLMDVNAFSCSIQLLLLNRMARDAYHFIGDICAAPPRVSLTMFGGGLSIEEFRTSSNSSSVILMSAPFVPRIMAEESVPSSHNEQCVNFEVPKAQPEGEINEGHNMTWAVRGLKRPSQPLELPRAEPMGDSEVSLLRRFVEAKEKGNEWKSDVEHGRAMVAAPTPSVEQVNRAADSVKESQPTASGSRQSQKLSHSGLGRFVAEDDGDDDDDDDND